MRAAGFDAAQVGAARIEDREMTNRTADSATVVLVPRAFADGDGVESVAAP
jgi:hypothetical protein